MKILILSFNSQKKIKNINSSYTVNAFKSVCTKVKRQVFENIGSISEPNVNFYARKIMQHKHDSDPKIHI